MKKQHDSFVSTNFFKYKFLLSETDFQIFFKFKSAVSYLRDFTFDKFTIVVKIISDVEIFRTLEELSGDHGFKTNSI